MKCDDVTVFVLGMCAYKSWCRDIFPAAVKKMHSPIQTRWFHHVEALFSYERRIWESELLVDFKINTSYNDLFMYFFIIIILCYWLSALFYSTWHWFFVISNGNSYEFKPMWERGINHSISSSPSTHWDWGSVYFIRFSSG